MSNTLADKYPDLIKEWDFNLNKELDPTTIPTSSNKRVSWICLKNPEHIWQTSIAHRTAGTKCPYCSNQKILPSNSLATINPDLANEWHPTFLPLRVSPQPWNKRCEDTVGQKLKPQLQPCCE